MSDRLGGEAWVCAGFWRVAVWRRRSRVCPMRRGDRSDGARISSAARATATDQGPRRSFRRSWSLACAQVSRNPSRTRRTPAWCRTRSMPKSWAAFPDSDVADSLQHLPGITITRTTGGEGQKVSVRGFGPQYNIVTLNNRILATDDDARDLAFDVLPSEVISGCRRAEVDAGFRDGGQHRRYGEPAYREPLRQPPGWHGGAHVEGNYNDMSKLYGKKFSAFIENTLLDQTLGFLVGGVISNNHTRTDSLNAYTQNFYGPTFYPFDATDAAAAPCPSPRHRVASPSARFSTTRSAKRCPAASSGARTIRSSWSRTACGPSSRTSRSATTSHTISATDDVGTGWSQSDHQQRRGHGSHGEQLPAGDRQQHHRSQCRDLAVRVARRAGSRPTGSSWISTAIAPPPAARKAAPTPS